MVSNIDDSKTISRMTPLNSSI